jgi:hypothetical protein
MGDWPRGQARSCSCKNQLLVVTLSRSAHWSVNLERDYVECQIANFKVPSTSFVQHIFGIFAWSATSDLDMVKGGVA